ncbi:FIG006045: Sigma factor, ECF subfamily [plant metagenome]|uniref:FIG006045: Sigma factor, ECF subfamily n=1 Tax=plant metagenome TaxID=1297885 RepID=A0A484P3R4_9ZZZZ
MTDLSARQTVEALYLAHHGWLRGWFRRRLGDAFESADLAHDTFLRLMTSRRVHALRDEPRALITHIAKGLLVDHWRRRDVEQAYLDALALVPEAVAPSPEAGLLIVEALLRVDALLDSLPVFTRDVFLMAQLDGMTLREIAQQTGKPAITVRRHIHRALMACMLAAE